MPLSGSVTVQLRVAELVNQPFVPAMPTTELVITGAVASTIGIGCHVTWPMSPPTVPQKSPGQASTLVIRWTLEPSAFATFTCATEPVSA